MSARTFRSLTMLMLMALPMPILVRAEEQPQPPVFMWTFGRFANRDSGEDMTGLYFALSYCGQDHNDLSLPALNVAGNVVLQISGHPTPFTVRPGTTDISREHIWVLVPASSLPDTQGKPFEIQWRVGAMTSNVLVADISKKTIESTTLYPTTPRPEKLQGVGQISYADYNWTEKTETRFLDKQQTISFFFGGNGPKPWRFSYLSLTGVGGIKGKKATLETRRSVDGDISNDEVLDIWNKLVELGIPMPSWRDNPKSEVGQKWDWHFFTNPDGKRVFPTRDEEYYARRVEQPLTIRFDYQKGGVESCCEYSAAKDSKMWRSITELFVNYSNRNDPSFKQEVTLLETQGDDQACVSVSLQELLANPKKYHGKRVRVSGYYHSEFEHSSLSAGPDSADNYKESVWLGGMSYFAKPEDVSALNDTFITVEGSFTAGHGGHLGLWPGEVERLTKIRKQTSGQGGGAKPATRPKSR